jgi:hypothetical protein
MPLFVVAAFLRLGRKYEFTKLFKQAVARLSHEFPSTLKEWDQVSACYSLIDMGDGFTFDVINLARENALPFVLPAAFYNCCLEATTFDQIFQGVRKQGNTIAILSTEDQQICIKGWRRLIEMQAESLYLWLDAERNRSVFDMCTSPTRCAATRSTLRSLVLPPISECRTLDPWHDDWEQNMCLLCVQAAMSYHQTVRQELWDWLPSVFSLPPWVDLLKEGS